MTAQSFLDLGISEQLWPLAPPKGKKASFWILAVLLVPVAVLGFIKGVFHPDLYFSQEHINIHLGIELFGGFVAFLVCITISVTARGSSIGSPFFIMAFVAMGIFDVFHAFSPPNSNQFVLLHSLSVLWGGLLVFVALLIQRLRWKTPSPRTIYVGLNALLLVNLLWALYGYSSFPPMTEGGVNKFTLGSITLNSVGSVFYFLATILLYQAFNQAKTIPLFVFTIVFGLFSVSGILFPLSTLWDGTWWLWHAIRMTLYMVILGLLAYSYILTIQEIQRSRDEVTEINKRLQKQQQELQLILASTAEGIFGMDREGRCTFANRASVALLGYQDERALRGQDIHALIHHSRPDGTPYPREECRIYKAWRQGQIAEVDDDVFWRADGSHFSTEYRSYPMIRDGQVVGTVVSFTNITERKEKEAQLLQAQKMEVVGQLTGGIAHDFNNLLTIILGNLDFLSTELGQQAAPDIHELLGDAFSAAREATDLTQRLLALSRRQALKPKYIGLDRVVQNLQKFLRRILGEQFELLVNTPNNILTVFADPSQLDNALLNLIINARDAMPRGGTLTLDIFRKTSTATEVASSGLTPGSYAVMRITDSGIGMSPEVLSHAIEPFFTTKTSGKGTGLGLSMVYSFAKQSGGELRLQSKPGLGTSVSLLLPEADPFKERAATKTESNSWQGGSETILVVEDEPRVRKLLTRRLSNLGYRVIESENAQSAKRLIESQIKVDLLFSDIVMPGEMNGYDLVGWAREERPELKLLLTTGADSEHAVKPNRKTDEHVPLLRKPYSEKMLQETIRSLLDTL